MPRNSVEYEEDFYAWTVEQSRLLRAGELSAIDVANIAEEIESMGRSDRRELRSRLVVLAMHLLKWRRQPGARSRSWSATIDEQRLQIEEVLAESPAFGPWWRRCYRRPTQSLEPEQLQKPVSLRRFSQRFVRSPRTRFCLARFCPSSD